MSKGHVIFAQNSDVDYVRQAYALALTIKKFNKINQVCLITNNQVPEKYKIAFDYIIDIPFGDLSIKSLWKIENRWKLIYASPFEETLVYDSDMIVLNSNDYWWPLISEHDLLFTMSVKDYRGNVITNHVLRKCIVENNLPDLYFGIHYFKKTKKAFEFYKWLEIITKDYKDFYSKFAPNNTQKFCSMDVSAAIAMKIIDNGIPDNPLSFVHMKKEIQGWKTTPVCWNKALLSNYTKEGKLFLSNNLQKGIFHYTEDEFLTDEIVSKIEKL